MTRLVHIVDDDADFADGLAWLLDSRGLKTRCWSTGQEFLDAMGHDAAMEPSCVVLLDIRMEPL